MPPSPAKRPVLLVASTGGHLAQLHRLRPRLFRADDPTVWATFDTPQSRSLLAGEDVRYVRFTESRDWRNVVANAGAALAIIRRERPQVVISTGSAIALSFLPAARLAGVPAAYLESAARSEGPSLTGRIVSRIPGVQLSTQYPGWAEGAWSYRGSVFDEFAAGPRVARSSRPLRVVVSLGTIRFDFRRLVDRLREILPADAEVLWQTGHTDVSDLPFATRATLPGDELRRAVAEADVLVSHAGVGSALDALALGRHPVLVSRRHAHGEHIDDHQALIAEELGRRGLACARTPETLNLADLLDAATRTVVATKPPAIEMPDVRPAGRWDRRRHASSAPVGAGPARRG